MDKLQTFEQFLASSSAQVSLTSFVINLIVAAVLSSLLGRLYVTYGKALSNRHMFARTFLMLTMTIMVIITIVKSSLALSLGLVGALSIVRFRTAIKEPEELTYAFLAIAIGLGLGANQLVLTLVAFAMISITIILRARLFKTKLTEFGNMRVSGATSDVDLEKITAILSSNTLGVTLKRLDETETEIEVLYAVMLDSFDDLVKVNKELKTLSPNLTTSYFDNIGNI
ncbi:MAG: DUF4956 domain-containing protein [Gammaproteobacteria bacterium]